MNRRVVYLVFGPQGSGKSTQAEFLSTKLKLPFFDSGSELRRIAEGESEIAVELSTTLKHGALVSNDILEDIFEEFISNHNCENGMVIDGFPRTIEQAKLLSKLSHKYNWEIVSFFVDISDETAKNRLSKRYKLVNGKKVFRSDDKPEVVSKRLELFKQETLPVIDWLAGEYVLHRIDGEPSRDEVFKEILSNINE